MALPLSNKIQRIITFLINARSPRLFAALASRGFSQAALDEGWQLVTIAAGARLRFVKDGDAVAPDQVRALLAELDEWENTWFPLVDATLTRRFPDLRERVLANLTQTTGAEVIITVSTLLDRIEGELGTDAGAAASALLAERGLNADVCQRARDIIASLQKTESAELPELEPQTQQEQEDALVEAWAWYREWSDIARTVIRRSDQLIRLGLRKVSRTTAADEPVAKETAEPAVAAFTDETDAPITN